MSSGVAAILHLFLPTITYTAMIHSHNPSVAMAHSFTQQSGKRCQARSTRKGVSRCSLLLREHSQSFLRRTTGLTCCF